MFKTKPKVAIKRDVKNLYLVTWPYYSFILFDTSSAGGARVGKTNASAPVFQAVPFLKTYEYGNQVK
ncbi:hypothetical protein B0W44_03705 [Novibacillus thermophilus]|uniref:Uncharacterized protein n=1 Tax=Novibacillus thermophilus TaxID=1471761 RepID=A0A1U9K4N3_9BACL|nr:hypothetical protein B0W44_03705 [Novibacillus thermophilus]